jgi:hypothetical protein
MIKYKILALGEIGNFLDEDRRRGRGREDEDRGRGQDKQKRIFEKMLAVSRFRRNWEVIWKGWSGRFYLVLRVEGAVFA